MDLSRVTIGIKTILRDEKLEVALDGILKTMPEARIIVVDDGPQSVDKDIVYHALQLSGHTVDIMPFDSGVGEKSNRIAELLATDYLLVVSDDFDFRPLDVRAGIEKMVAVLDKHKRYYAVSGRVNETLCEANLIFRETERGTEVTEVEKLILPQASLGGAFADVYDVDLTINYTLLRRETFWTPVYMTSPGCNGWIRNGIGWDNDVKAGGGEHGAFFIDMKRAGFKVGFVPGVNINTQNDRDSREYRLLRWRAFNPERPCFKKRGIRKYTMMSGEIDYDEEKNR